MNSIFFTILIGILILSFALLFALSFIIPSKANDDYDPEDDDFDEKSEEE
ncbi:hypothetical protein KKA50_00235 [Patescibacteria group bacterium]|nr:hypothetical protein [Patescibacteria group bacterium]